MSELNYTIERAREARQRIKTAVQLCEAGGSGSMPIAHDDMKILADYAGKLEYQLSKARQQVRTLQARLDDVTAI